MGEVSPSPAKRERVGERVDQRTYCPTNLIVQKSDDSAGWIRYE
jgi:hypothetical protein